ncbi:hypothetical protein KY311_00990 [Candidatus Woesearchaeota archaeon]|nr:hypothetical protein [Candidatus Woesearchaeota archaeon]MBW3017402.1 hypothetical protein [Candidatus Woesearchaeota archaeon]
METEEQIVLDAVQKGHGYCISGDGEHTFQQILKQFAREGRVDQEDAHLAIIKANEELAQIVLQAICNGNYFARFPAGKITIGELFEHYKGRNSYNENIAQKVEEYGGRIIARKTIEALENGFHASKLPKSDYRYSDAIKYCVRKGLVQENVAQALLGNSELAELKRQKEENG